MRKESPRAVPALAGALVHIRTERTVVLEAFSACKALGRFVLRQRGVTVAAGIITEVLG